MSTQLLRDRVAIITGAASGMGRAAAVKFAEHGAKVVAADIDDDGGRRTIDLIERAGGSGCFVHTDVALAEDARTMADTALARWGTIDILFNNAAATQLCNDRDRPVHLLDEAVWDRMLAVTLKSVFLCSKACLPTMIEQRRGVILNMSSVDAVLSEPGFDSYTAAKGGVLALTRSMAGEYGQYGIRVNAISPGYVITEVQQNWYESNAHAAAAADAAHALRRCGQPPEVAAMAVVLCSDLASFTTGAIVDVDGGYTAFKQVGAEVFCPTSGADTEADAP